MKKHKTRKAKKNPQKSKGMSPVSAIWRIAFKNPDCVYQGVMWLLDLLEQIGS